MWTVSFWKQTAERALKSGAQFVIYTMTLATGVGTMLGVDVRTLDWKLLGSAFLGGALFSVLTSLASLATGQKDSPSLVSTEGDK